MYHQSDQYAAPVSIPHQVDGIFTADWMHQLKNREALVQASRFFSLPPNKHFRQLFIESCIFGPGYSILT